MGRMLCHATAHTAYTRCSAIALVLVVSALLVLQAAPVAATAMTSFDGAGHRQQCQFAPAREPQPVFETTDTALYDNRPISPHRPRHQFCYTDSEDEPPILTVVTATHNPTSLLYQTAQMVTTQSLSNLRWLIVSDHTTVEESLEILDAVKAHPRTDVVYNTGHKGLPCARNFGLRYVQSKYVAFLDDDDMLELTAYEKLVWMLESNPELDLGAFYILTYGAKNFTWTAGFHEGFKVFEENRLPVASMIRVSALRSNQLQYNEAMLGGMEDWDLWLTLMEHGSWGYTIPEYLMWYRTRSDAERLARWPSLFAELAKAKLDVWWRHRSLLKSGVPAQLPKKDEQLEPAGWHASFSNVLYQEPGQRSMLLLVSTLHDDGVGGSGLALVSAMAEAGWKVTVVCTEYDGTSSVLLRPRVMQHTHDVFVLPTFLRLVDFPRFLLYLIKSRSISVAVLINCQLGYELLPLLKPRVPRVRFVDMLHAVTTNWLRGGYAWYSVLCAPHLDLTASATARVAAWVAKRRGEGAGADGPSGRLLVAPVGVHVPRQQDAAARRFTAESSRHVVVVGALDSTNRPLVAAQAIVHAGEDLVGEFLGIGSEEAALVNFASAANGQIVVHGYNSAPHEEEVMRRVQLIVLSAASPVYDPLVVARAMAYGVPVVACSTSVRDVAGDAAFSLIVCSGNDVHDAAALANAISSFFAQPVETRLAWGETASRVVRDSYDRKRTLPRLVSLLTELTDEAPLRAEATTNAVAAVDASGDPSPTLMYVLTGALTRDRPRLSLAYHAAGWVGDKKDGQPTAAQAQWLRDQIATHEVFSSDPRRAQDASGDSPGGSMAATPGGGRLGVARGTDYGMYRLVLAAGFVLCVIMFGRILALNPARLRRCRRGWAPA